MEDFEVEPVSRLWRNRIPVGLATLLAGLSFYLGLTYFTADCRLLQQILLAISLGSFWLLCVGFLVFGPDGPIEQLLAVILMVAIGLGLPVFGSGYLSKVPELRSQFCKECDSLKDIEDRIETNPEFAEDLASKCQPPERALQIQALLNWSDNLKAENNCVEAKEKLQKAQGLTAELPETEPNKTLKQRVTEKLQALEDSRACGPTPTPTETPLPSSTPSPAPTAAPTATELPTATPTPTPVLEITLLGKRPGRGVIDFKLIADGTPVPGLIATEVTASNPSGLTIKQLLPRSEKDPVCVIAVVDNSGSIKENEVKILRNTIEELNNTQKKRPGLELGMVVFDTGIVKELKPQAGPLDAKLITGTGQNTALWLGVDTGIKLASFCEAPELDRFLFVVTDGANNAGDKTKADVIRAASDTGIAICTVGINSDQLQAQPLKDVALGCAYNFAADVGAVSGSLQTILYDTGNSYRITAEKYECPVTIKVRGTSLEVCP